MLWGGNQIGQPGKTRVVVSGFAGQCPACGDAPDVAYDVFIHNDVIEDVRPADGTFSYLGLGETYIVLDD